MSPSEARRLAEARVGIVLREKWHLDRVLGLGGFGAVYAATHRAGKRVAIKLLHPQLSSDPDIRKRFLREAYAANSIDHPGVVSVLDDDLTEEGAAFLVMDLLEGETLEARRTRKGGGARGSRRANEGLS
jgi:serine/threonine-protein kinase